MQVLQHYYLLQLPCYQRICKVITEMKRMVLIPEERLLRYEERDRQRLGNTDSPEGIMYGGGEDFDMQQAINTFYAPPTGINPPKGVMYGGGEDSLSSEMIVRGIPKTMKTRAEALLAHLKERRDAITWDDMGQVLLNGVLIPKSNISDLISDAMRPRKHFNPVGVREFYNVLNEINIPKDLVRNERRWSEAEENKVLNNKKSPPGKFQTGLKDWITF